MPFALTRNAIPTVTSPPAVPAASQSRVALQSVKPFFGMIDAVIVEAPAEFVFPGAILREHAAAIWTWITRDLAHDLIDTTLPADDPTALPLLEAAMPEILSRIRGAVSGASTSFEAERRIKTQIGGEQVWERLPVVMNALKHRALLEKAKAFGRATNGIQDEAALGMALQSMPLQDQSAYALLMQAAVGQVANPSRLVAAVIRIAGDGGEAVVARAGFAPLIDALLAHAQNQIAPLIQVGAFADIDLICRSIERFHKLIRSVNGYIELSRGSRWTQVIASLIKVVSARIEPRLRDVAPDVNFAMRKAREGADRLDRDQLLAALNGVYLLATVRECRDSLAVNQLFDQIWTQTGQALEMHITRTLDTLRDNPGDPISAARLDAGIKMAELRFNADYADVLRRARDGIEKRAASAG